MRLSKKIKKYILYIIGAFLILSGITYMGEIPVPATCVIMAGILILPIINEKIKNKFSFNKLKSFLKNIVIIVLILIFFVNIPSQNTESNSEISANSTVEEKVDNADVSSDNSVKDTPTFERGEYTGNLKQEKRDGQGTFIWEDGTKYTGEWKDDQIEGEGTLTFTCGDVYTGSFKNNKRNGNGKYTFANGDIYEGNFEDDIMSGQGTYTFSNGDKYQGQFTKNMFNGEGTYIKDGIEYKGNWIDNKYSK